MSTGPFPGGPAGALADRLPVGRLAAFLFAVSVVPLALLTYFSLSLSSEAVSNEVEARVRTTAKISSALVEQELRTLAELVASYAARPQLVDALVDERLTPAERAQIGFELRALSRARDGIAVSFVADPDGRLIEILPRTPSILGKDYSFRDWYRGVISTRRTYVSEAYRTQAAGHELVVAAAALVRSPPRPRQPRRILGILVAGYSLEHLRRYAGGLGSAQDVTLTVTDQRGRIVASPRGDEAPVPRRHDAAVAAALAGRSGVRRIDTGDGTRLAAYAPIPRFGWTVTASVPAHTALAAVGRLRSTVLGIAALLLVVLLAGLAAAVAALRARRRAETRLAEQVAVTCAVLEATADGLAMVGNDGRVVLSNSRMSRLARDLFGELPETATLAEQQAVITERMADPKGYLAANDAIADDPVHSGLDEWQLADSGRTIQRYTAPVRDGSGAHLGRIYTLREVTAEREAEQLKADLLATVSHELRTPLASILGFAELLDLRDVDRATQRRYLHTIRSEAQRLTALINDFLDAQRIEHGGLTVAIEPVDICRVLAQAVELFTGQSEAHSLELELEGPRLRVAADRERVVQVVANLLSNAIKYSPRGGTVRVRAERVESAIRVSVTDDGLGIPGDQQSSIFTKFFRADSSDTRSIGGTGLGLALSRQIVEAHGGRIGFTSVEGRGSTFWFELPASVAEERRPTALVVEDDAGAAALLTHYLEEEGFEVATVATGEEAVARVKEDPPALITLDIGLAGTLDGWEVLERLKRDESTRRVPVVVCTGSDAGLRAALFGASEFLAKPFSAEQLRSTVARLLPGHRGQVLVVDDEEAVRSLVSGTLSGDGIRVREAGDGEQALARVAEDPPDVIILDLVLPGVDGFEVLERLQADRETRSIPVVVLTGRRLSGHQRELLVRRAVAVLEKTAYSAEELRRLVREAVAA